MDETAAFFEGGLRCIWPDELLKSNVVCLFSDVCLWVPGWAGGEPGGGPGGAGKSSGLRMMGYLSGQYVDGMCLFAQNGFIS